MTRLKFKHTPAQARAAWIKALRSKEYKRGTGRLLTIEAKGDKVKKTFCCLGVACDVFAKLEPQYRAYWTGGGDFFPSKTSDENNGGVLPRTVREWLGLTTPNGEYGDGDRALSSRNDNGATFLELAYTIERNIGGLAK